MATVCPAAYAFGASQRYRIDPDHTFPSFEADHMGMSHWRGKFNRSSGEIVLDKTAGTGTVDVRIDPASIDFGQDALHDWAVGPEFLDVASYPDVRYRGRLQGFGKGGPMRVVGELTLHGVTRPLTLQVSRFKCIAHPVFKRDWCGADAQASFDRALFGLDAGKDWGFDMQVTLRIQVEALLEETDPGRAANGGAG